MGTEDTENLKKRKRTRTEDNTENIPKTQMLFVGNLAPTPKEKDVRHFFEGCGKIIRVRFSKDNTGRFKGFLHVDFATESAAKKAVLKNNEEFNGRPVTCTVFEEPDYKSFEGVVVTVENFSFIGFDETRESLTKKFEHCGAIKDVFLPKDKKGKAFIAFENKGALAQALSLKSQGLKIHVAGGYPKTLNQCGYEGGYGGIYGYPFKADKKKKRQI